MVSAANHAADQGRAWTEHCVNRERKIAQVALKLIIALQPIWAALDFAVEPELMPLFLCLRAPVIVVALCVLVLIRRSSRLSHIRFFPAVVAALIGVVIVVQLALIGDHQLSYLLGFSLLFWGTAMLCIWPRLYTAVALGVPLAAHVVGWLIRPNHVSPADFIGSLAYLGSATVMAGALIGLRRRLEHDAFVTTFTLARRNLELATATTTLARTQARLAELEKLSALGRLLAQLSHEINNPLNVLHNNIPPLQESLAQLGTVLAAARSDLEQGSKDALRLWVELDLDFVQADSADALASMGIAVDRIGAIQRDLREFLRLDLPVVQAGDVNETLRAPVAQIARHLPPGVVIREDYGVLPSAVFDPVQLDQLFSSLLRNAVEAVGTRGTIIASSREVNGAIELSVADDGPGFSDEARLHLFEPLFTTKGVGRGLGMGLASCHRIARQHGGSIALAATEGAGARIVVTLPIDGAAVDVGRSVRPRSA